MPFCVEIQTQFHVFVQTLRSDNVKEYLSEPFQLFMLQHEVLRHTLCVDTPSQNKVAKSYVFKGKSITRDIFIFVKRGESLKALRRKLFVITYII